MQTGAQYSSAAGSGEACARPGSWVFAVSVGAGRSSQCEICDEPSCIAWADIEDGDQLFRWIDDGAAGVGGVLAEWHSEKAPLVGLLGYELRSRTVPLIAVCHNDEEAEIAALLVGCDSVVGPTVNARLLQAHLIACRRLATSSRATYREEATRFPASVQPAEMFGSNIQEALQVKQIRLNTRSYRAHVGNEEVSVTPLQLLLRAGETVDVLMEVSNPGLWMVHCHIAEHVESGMMFTFHVARPTV